MQALWKLLLILAAALPLAGTAFAAESYLDDGLIKIGVDPAKGGSITYLSLSGTTNNIVNNHDLGRQIQQSYYSGPLSYNPSNNVSPAWTNWPWNPIQTGDCFGHPSPLLALTNDGRTLYVKCQPMQWALSNVPGQCTIESWISLTGNVVIVSNRLLNLRTDTTQQFTALNQELPAVYTIGNLYRLFTYAGNAPFTGDTLTNLPQPSTPTWANWRATEGWAALVDTNNWGLGVFHPGIIQFNGGFSGTTNAGGPADNPTGYLAPTTPEILDSNIEYTYTYYLVLGTLAQIRDRVYAQPRRPACNFVFKSDRQHWTYQLTSDPGWPVTNRLHVSLDSNDPQLWSPPCFFAATNVPKLYIRAAFQIAHPAGRATGQLFWDTNSTTGFIEACSVIFPLLADGQFHTYELDLAASNNYSGFITQLRFDPAFNGEPGDYADIAAISSFPFAGNDAAVPALNLTQTNGTITATFAAVSGATAGFIGQDLIYDLQTCPDLAAGNWQGVSGCTNVIGNDQAKPFSGLPGGSAAFYRVKVHLQ